MLLSEAYNWLIQSQRRIQVMSKLIQPMTVKQLHHNTVMSLDSGSYILYELEVYGLVKCLNSCARRSRVYWLTERGKSCQKIIRLQLRLPQLKYDFPSVDWKLYGWVCFSHRNAVLKTLVEPMQPSEIVEPMQPSEIKRKAHFHNPNLRMSANNVRDVIRLFLEKGVVESIETKAKAHPRYQLTEIGKKLQLLLFRAETVSDS